MGGLLSDVLSLRLTEEISLMRPAIGLAILVATLSLYFVRKRRVTSSNSQLPPLVPGGHFWLGNVNCIDPKRPHISLTALSKKHGDIFRLRILREDIVVLNSIELIKEALITQSKQFAGRPPLFRIDYGFHYKKDIIFGTYTAKWAYMKRVLSQGLRMFGTGEEAIDDVIKEEMQALVDVFKTHGNDDFDPRLTLMTAVVNGVTASAIGKRYDHDDPQMKRYQHTTKLFSESCSIVEGMELDLFPWLRFLPNRSFAKLTQARKLLDDLVDGELKRAKTRYDPNNLRCIVDVLLKARDDGVEDDNDILAITDEDIRCIFVDLLVSGTFTTAVALSAFVLFMIHYPKLQYQLRAEVDRIVGKERVPSSGDRANMPVLEATILEIMRYISHVPLNLPHFTTQAVSIGEYRIPKGTKVLTNFWAVHHDPRLWKEPWKFNPRRFLDINNRLVPAADERRKNLIPFSGGRRACMGENLARERLFLFSASLLQKFQLLPPSGGELSSSDPRDFDLGLILEPRPFSIRAVQRKRLQKQTSSMYIDTML